MVRTMKINACRVITNIWKTAQPHCINPPASAKMPPPRIIIIAEINTVLPVEILLFRFIQQTPQIRAKISNQKTRLVCSPKSCACRPPAANPAPAPAASCSSPGGPSLQLSQSHSGAQTTPDNSDHEKTRTIINCCNR